MSDTLTVVITDIVTNLTATANEDFVVESVVVQNPGDQTDTVGQPI